VISIFKSVIFAVIERCPEVLSQNDLMTALDMTGGAPELHPDFDYFVVEARKLGKRVMVRHNLTVIFDGNPRTRDRKDYLPEFFAEQQVEIIASLPHFNEEYVRRQRGNGVFQKSIDGIRQLNEAGYGKEATGLILNLVHNADGPVPQQPGQFRGL
jgi:radical SAM/Cys-rich protein